MSNNKKLFELRKPFLIMVEGRDDAAMLYKLLKHMDIPSDSFQIFKYGGKQQFPSALRSISNLEAFERVNKLAIFRDADDSSKSAVQSIEHHLKACNIPIKYNDSSALKVGIYIMPNCQDIGALESLLLSSLSDEMKEELYSFVTKAETHLNSEKPRKKYKHSEKSKTYAYSALFENANFRDSFSKQIWDYDHHAFDKLKAFLRDFG